MGFNHPFGALFICGRVAPDICPHCGTEEHARCNTGKVVNHNGLIVTNLALFRCMTCGFTEVWDMGTDQWWELDESDYSDEGSFEEVS
jgi:predicted RNA-binding Zn-ribbon protein involved in translation (DUF1610 family)